MITPTLSVRVEKRLGVARVRKVTVPLSEAARSCLGLPGASPTQPGLSPTLSDTVPRWDRATRELLAVPVAGRRIATLREGEWKRTKGECLGLRPTELRRVPTGWKVSLSC